MKKLELGNILAQMALIEFSNSDEYSLIENELLEWSSSKKVAALHNINSPKETYIHLLNELDLINEELSSFYDGILDDDYEDYKDCYLDLVAKKIKVSAQMFVIDFFHNKNNEDWSINNIERTSSLIKNFLGDFGAEEINVIFDDDRFITYFKLSNKAVSNLLEFFGLSENTILDENRFYRLETVNVGRYNHCFTDDDCPDNALVLKSLFEAFINQSVSEIVFDSFFDGGRL